ncbi:hypothetical protein L6164_023300 [Bauhinia variegata]|uniref:Uncharacterized protein n=1 Tax=Bauhinia variegata TaxID=167791 RepID=A0ACB9ML51_BAUVA|nr:hypothetical protein L6164_023300 [Bauhinia variegata]
MARISTFLVVLLLLLLCFWTPIAESTTEYVTYKDPKAPIGARVRSLMKMMTLPEKIGQLIQAERGQVNADIVKQYFIGSVLSSGGSAPRPEASPKDWVDMINGFQNGSLSTRLGIPMLYASDAVHGHNNAYNATIFPHNVGLGVTRDPDLVKRIGVATALEARATGVGYVFAPCIAVCRDPRWGKCYESYSEDAEIVRMMTEIIPGLQGDVPNTTRKGVPFVNKKDNKVVACAKHFVGDGGTFEGIDGNNTVISNQDLFRIHVPAYWDSIYKGVSTIMVSFSSLNGVKMHANYHMVTRYLKQRVKFRGFVITDFQGIDKITPIPGENYTYSVQEALLAGIDMIMIGYNNYIDFINITTKLVEQNVVPMSRIDDAVQRILRVKFTMGLFENPLANYNLADKVGCKEHRELAREAVRKSLVLLRNGKGGETLLPLHKNAPKILVAGTHADNLGYQCGGWTIDWQGRSGNDLTVGTTILQAIRATVDSSTDVTYEENPTDDFVKSGNFTYAVVVVGERPYAEYMGDSNNLFIPAPGPDTIINVCENVKCVVILVSGRPLVIGPYIATADAFVAAWLPGTEGQGVADVLFGDYGFTGKLARTWFRRVDQLPMNIGDPHYDALFPIGYGLTTNSTSQ